MKTAPRLVLAVLTITSLCVSSPGFAKRVFIDFGDSNLETSGNSWSTNGTDSFELDRTGDKSCGSPPCTTGINLGFDINFGSGPVGSLFVNENGIVSFGSPPASGSFASIATLMDLGLPVIAPYYANLVSVAPVDGVFSVNDGEMLFSRGIADPDDDQNGIYSQASAVPAVHVTWAGLTTGSSPEKIFTDLVIYSRGSGDFDVRFGYGTDANATVSVLGSHAGVALGSGNLREFTGPYSASTDYFFQFRNGQLQAVPAPAAVWLMATGVAALACRRGRYRNLTA